MDGHERVKESEDRMTYLLFKTLALLLIPQLGPLYLDALRILVVFWLPSGRHSM